MNSISHLLVICLLPVTGLMARYAPAQGAVGLNATEYYVAKNGSDNNTGTITQPFKTIQKAASIMSAGNTCYVRTGVYRETIIPVNSGSRGAPIRFIAYNEEVVTVSGADVLDVNWSVYQGSIYMATTAVQFKQLFVDGKMMNEARWPNANVDSLVNMPRAKAGTGSTSNLIVDSSLPPGDWNGATLWVVPNWWSYTKTVTSYKAGDRLTFSPILSDEGNLIPKYYYLSGKLAGLDIPTEWYLDEGMRKVFLWAPNSQSPEKQKVEVKQRELAFDLTERSYIEVTGFKLFAAAVKMTGSYCIIDRCEGRYIEHFTKCTRGEPEDFSNIMAGSHNEWRNSIIAFNSGNGITVDGSNNKVTNCIIHDVDYFGVYGGCIYVRLSNSNGHEFSHNTLYNSGRFCIGWLKAGQKMKIEYNDCYKANLLTDDGGAIYTWNTEGNGTSIDHNWVHDNKWTGIYIDNGSRNYKVHHNVSWNNAQMGITLNLPSYNNLVYNNTIFNNKQSFFVWGRVGYVGAQSQVGTKIINNIAKELIQVLKNEYAPELRNNGYYSFGSDFVPVAGSGAIDAGEILPGYTDGYTGSAPDIGAYEYGLPPWKPGADHTGLTIGGRPSSSVIKK